MFTSCPDECADKAIDIGVPKGGTAVFDARVMFRDGGACSNQGVQVLQVSKESQEDFVYVCSNLDQFQGKPCDNSNYPRFTVLGVANCTRDCKYNIFLHLDNFDASDEGLYTIQVNFERLGNTERRILRKRVYFGLIPGGNIIVQHNTN